MKMRINTYLILLTVFVLSFGMAVLIPANEILKYISSIPAIVALVAIIYQISRDHSAYLKELEIQQKQHDFSLGVTSHMAQVAFDKHVEFCEKYMSEVHKTISTLWSEGTTTQAIDHSQAFGRLRIEYATWITDEISNQLKPFENALFRIGSRVRLSERCGPTEMGQKAYIEADELWCEVLGETLDKVKTPDENIAVEKIKNRIRAILGIQELTELRGLLINKAIKNIKDI